MGKIKLSFWAWLGIAAVAVGTIFLVNKSIKTDILDREVKEAFPVYEESIRNACNGYGVKVTSIDYSLDNYKSMGKGYRCYDVTVRGTSSSVLRNYQAFYLVKQLDSLDIEPSQAFIYATYYFNGVEYDLVLDTLYYGDYDFIKEEEARELRINGGVAPKPKDENSKNNSSYKPSGGKSGSSGSKKDDFYNVYDYWNVEDFYFDWEEDFEDIEDAEDYFYEHTGE